MFEKTQTDIHTIYSILGLKIKLKNKSNNCIIIKSANPHRGG